MADHILTFIGANLLLDNMNYLLKIYRPDLSLQLANVTDYGSVSCHGGEMGSKTLSYQSPLNAGALSIEEKEIREQAEQIALLYYIVYDSLAGFDKTGEFRMKLNNTFLLDYDSLRKKVNLSSMQFKKHLPDI